MTAKAELWAKKTLNISIFAIFDGLIVNLFFVLCKAPGLMKSFLTCISGPHLQRAATRTAQISAKTKHSGSSSVREGETEGLSKGGARNQGEPRFTLDQKNHCRSQWGHPPFSMCTSRKLKVFLTASTSFAAIC